MKRQSPRSSVITVLSIFLIATAVVAGLGVIGFALYWFFTGVVFVDGVASIGIMLVFTVVAWKTRITWEKPAAAAVLIAITAWVGMFMDIRGNPIYNKPLEWIFAPPGATLLTKEIVSHGGGSTGVNYDFNFVDTYGGIVRTLSSWVVAPFRFFEYLVVMSAVMWPITLIRRRFGPSAWLPPPSR